MLHVRSAAVSGQFYPGDARRLDEMITRFLGDVDVKKRPAKAVIAPHAGYIYSGPIAASAYAQLAPLADAIKRVVLLGPAHRVSLRGLAASSADAFETPLGIVEVDKEAVKAVLALPQVQIRDDAHALEHSLEVHLPFLQKVFRNFRIVPLAVGMASAAEVAEVLQKLWGGPETLIVISSDLSHYHDYETAQKLDKATSTAIETLKPEAIGHDQACGLTPIQGLLQVARERGLTVTTLDLRNSGDTAGPRSQVVGYGAWVIG